MHRQRTEMALLRPLVLLSICCVSAAAPQDGSENKTILTKPGGDTPPSVLNQQMNIVLDFNSVLRDIIVQMAELKRQNEEQSTTLKELELQKSEVEKLQQQDKQQQLLLKQQQQQIQAQAAELVTMKTKANFTEKQVEALRKDREVWQVAFSAYLQASGGYRGPFDTDTNLIFRYVIENIGNAYNPLTGLFTAPVRGAYHFEFYIFGISKPYPMAKLMKNDQMVCTAYQYQSSGGLAASNGATLLLEVGDVVFLRLPANYRIYEDTNYHYNTFSGHLLFTM